METGKSESKAKKKGGKDEVGNFMYFLIPKHLDEEHLKHIKEIFDMFDANKDGTIDTSEFKSLMSSLGREVSHDMTS